MPDTGQICSLTPKCPILFSFSILGGKNFFSRFISEGPKSCVFFWMFFYLWATAVIFAVVTFSVMGFRKGLFLTKTCNFFKWQKCSKKPQKSKNHKIFKCKKWSLIRGWISQGTNFHQKSEKITIAKALKIQKNWDPEAIIAMQEVSIYGGN